MNLPTTTMTAAIHAVLSTLGAHSWPAPIHKIGFRGPTALIETDSDVIQAQTPALYLHCVSRRGDDPSIEQSAKPASVSRIIRRCQWQIFCLLSMQTPHVETEILEMTESVCALIERREFAQSPRRGHRWGLSGALGYPVGLEDVEADLGIHGIMARIIQWEQPVYFSELSPVNL